MKGILRIRNLKNNSTISFFLLFRASSQRERKVRVPQGWPRIISNSNYYANHRGPLVSLSLSPATNVDTVKIHPTNLQRWRAIDIQFKSRALALHQPDSFPFPSTVFGVELVGVCHALKCNRSQPVSTCCWPIAPYLYYTGLAFDLFGYSTDVHGRKMQ
jgi:hypothetical protein